MNIKIRNIISECTDRVIKRYINEAMDDTFSLDELSSLRSYAARVRYCKQHLGYPIGNGSSRIVFQIDDEKCLKLAKNEKGIAQNEVEYDKYAETYDVTPALFECDNDSKWIVTEYVLPAKAQDFKECLGIDFRTFQNFVICANNCYARRPSSTDMSDEQFCELVDNNEWLDNLYHYMSDYQVPCGDILKLANLGMVMRHGEPQIVILDSGLNQDVYERYYSCRR